MLSKIRALRGVLACSVACVAMLAAGTAGAQTGENLARQNNCLACHQLQTKRVGPAFAAVAERFAGQEGAQDYLAQAIRNGGRGRWGAIPMPAQPQVDEREAHELAGWILGLTRAD